MKKIYYEFLQKWKNNDGDEVPYKPNYYLKDKDDKLSIDELIQNDSWYQS